MRKFTIKDLNFEIESAILKVFFDDDEDVPSSEHTVVWGVCIEAVSQDERADWDVEFRATRILETRSNVIRSWRELDGRHGGWGHDEEDDERASLYTYSHESVLDANWQFQLVPSGRLALLFNGMAKFNHPNGYVGNLPISIETDLDFVPIRNGYLSEKVTRAQVAQFGLVDPYRFETIDDVSCLVCENYPKA